MVLKNAIINFAICFMFDTMSFFELRNCIWAVFLKDHHYHKAKTVTKKVKQLRKSASFFSLFQMSFLSPYIKEHRKAFLVWRSLYLFLSWTEPIFIAAYWLLYTKGFDSVFHVIAIVFGIKSLVYFCITSITYALDKNGVI